MALETSLTSKTWNPFDGSTYVGSPADQIEFDYSTLGFTPSAGDSYKSTSGDVFKVYVNGVRIYRASDADYASGTGFLEDGDTVTTLNSIKQANGTSTTAATWADTHDNVWTIDTANQLVTIDTGNILATALYKTQANSGLFASGYNSAGTANPDIAFSSSTIIEVRRASQNESSPSVDFSNASILTEQDLDNSSLNVFHMAQQAVVTAEKALPFNSGSGVYEAYQPGTLTRKKITQVADGVADNDAVNIGQFAVQEVAVAADLALTNADVVLTHADVVLTHADEVLTRADTVLTAADVVTTNADVVITNADVVAANASADAVAVMYDAFHDKFLGSMADGATQGTNPTTNGTWAKNSSSITVVSASNIKVGQVVTGTGIPKPTDTPPRPKPNVISIDGTTVVISDNMDALGSAVALTFTGYGIYGDFNGGKDGPALNNDGDALADGMLYFNTSDDVMLVYDETSSAWKRTTPTSSEQTAINAVNADATDIGAVAGKATEIGRLGTTDAVADLALLGTTAIADPSTGDLKLVADIHANVTSCAAISEDITQVVGELVYKEDLGGIADAVTTSTGNNITDVADNETNINAVAGKATEIGRLGTVDAVADMAILGSTTVTDDMALLAIPAVITDMDLLGATGVIADMDAIGATGVIDDLETVANISANVATVAGISANTTTVAGISANVTTVAGVSANVTTVAGSIADVNRYANEYTIASSAPGSPSEGDLWYDSTNNVLKYHTGSAFSVIAAGLGEVADDTSPTLGGNLDVGGNSIVSVSNADITIAPNGSGEINLNGTVNTDNLTIDFGSIA